MTDKQERQFYNELVEYYGEEVIKINSLHVIELIKKYEILTIFSLLKKWNKEEKCQLLKDGEHQIYGIVLIN